MVSTFDTRVERLRREYHALKEVSKTLTAVFDLPDLLAAIIEKVVAVVEPAEVGAIMLWDQSAGLFRPWAACGYDLEILKDIGLQAGESITGKVFDQGQASLLVTPEEISEAMQDMRPANRAVMARSLGTDRSPVCTLAAPIAVGPQKFGVLVLETLDGTHPFSHEDVPFVQTIADLIAIAIERARLQVRADAIREEREAERLRSELMATLSHELRLPLTTIQGYASALLLEDVGWSEEKRREFLLQIDEECHSMQTMLKDILDSALIDVDQLIIEPQPVRLPHIAQQVTSEIQLRSDIHRILVDFPPEYPILEADPRWIKQVFRNILDNAVKYSPDGGLIVVRGEVRQSDVVVIVADQGIGISPEDLIPLFEKYYRVRSSAIFHISGTGLGLPISRAIIEAHGGRIWAESKIGEGTTVYFSLPLSKSLTDE